MWKFLDLFVESVNEAWFIAGDFSSVLNSSDRKEGAVCVRAGCDLFKGFVFNHGIRDVGVLSPRFTWSRGNLSQDSIALYAARSGKIFHQIILFGISTS